MPHYEFCQQKFFDIFLSNFVILCFKKILLSFRVGNNHAYYKTIKIIMHVFKNPLSM